MMKASTAAGISIRPYGPQDEAHWLRLMNTLRPHPLTPQAFRARDRRWPADDLRLRLVGGAGGTIGVIGQLQQSPYLPRSGASVMIITDPDFRQGGMGTTMLRSLVHAAGNEGMRFVSAEIDRADRALQGWALRRGFRQNAARIGSTLNLSAFQVRVTDDLRASMLQQGIELRPLGGDAIDVETLAFAARCIAESPDMVGVETWSVQRARTILQEPSTSRPGWIILARQHARPVGVAVMHDHRAHAYLYFYGVVREMRGRGIATAMAAMLAEKAALAGFDALHVDNLETNRSALDVNRRLGFEVQSIRDDLRLMVRGSAEPTTEG